MNFQSLSFLVFLPATVLLCLWARRKKRLAEKLLLLASGVFCLLSPSGLKGFWALLIGCAVTDAAVERMRSGKWRRGALLFGCCYHIAVLMAFKYTGFFTGGAVSIGWVPVGLSFFTFQQLWLLKEVYTGEYIPETGDDLALYGFFFPALASGPILRLGTFFPQLRGAGFLRPGGQDIAAALYAICTGMAKKVLLADSLGTVVNNGWAMAADLSAPAAWLVMLGYTLQLYLDFSGYCDIATGCARLLGIRLPVNFNSPYRSLSVTEFWKRWHITLTTFLRECVYFPLGGSRRGIGRACFNILIVFLISGFWHGAGWTFIVWGALHGLAQILERVWGNQWARLPEALQWVMTFLFVNVAWVFFRAPGLCAAGMVLSAAFAGGRGLPLEALAAGALDSEVTAVTTILPMLTDFAPALVLFALLGVGLLVALWPKNTIQKMEEFQPRPVTAVVCGVLLVWAVLSFSSTATFIYSNF